MSSWKGLKKRAAKFEALGVRVLGIASDSPEQLAKLCRSHELPFTMLSDPMLASQRLLDIPVSSRVSYLTALPIHPVLRHLPKKGFLQPALLLWRADEQLHAWRQTEKLRNLYGASGRPSARDILDITRRSLDASR